MQALAGPVSEPAERERSSTGICLKSYALVPWATTMQEAIAWMFSLLGLAACFASVDLLRSNGVLGPGGCRKATHIGERAIRVLQDTRSQVDISLNHLLAAGTGLVYLLFWPLYSQGPLARFVCATVPGLASLYFFLVGIGACKDKSLLERSTVKHLTLTYFQL